MESSTRHVGPDPVERIIPLSAKAHEGEPRDAEVDPYAQAELERRHERIELMIEKAQRAT
jgi:hypothetical protein